MPRDYTDQPSTPRGSDCRRVKPYKLGFEESSLAFGEQVKPVSRGVQIPQNKRRRAFDGGG